MSLSAAPFRDRISRHILIILGLALAPAFTVTALVDNAYRARQRAFAASWAARGDAALAAHRPEQAVDAFRNALMFSREDRTFRLRLAEALANAGRGAEARAYLLPLWEDQPGNGPVNLALARIAAENHDLTAAIRYYHTSIEGAWADRVEQQRRQAHIELADFLVTEGATAQAQAELIALAGDLPPEASGRHHVAELMLRVGLARQAMAIYRGLRSEDRRDRRALEGSGRAAFAIGQYAEAASDLMRASREAPLGAEAATDLEVARLVVSLDPFQHRLRSAERSRRTEASFGAASARLQMCPQPLAADLQVLDAERAALAPKLKPRSVARDQDLMEAAMDLAFRLEHASSSCGPRQPIDRALLLIAQQHQGSSP